MLYCICYVNASAQTHANIHTQTSLPCLFPSSLSPSLISYTPTQTHMHACMHARTQTPVSRWCHHVTVVSLRCNRSGLSWSRLWASAAAETDRTVTSTHTEVSSLTQTHCCVIIDTDITVSSLAQWKRCVSAGVDAAVSPPVLTELCHC